MNDSFTVDVDGKQYPVTRVLRDKDDQRVSYYYLFEVNGIQYTSGVVYERQLEQDLRKSRALGAEGELQRILLEELEAEIRRLMK